MTAAINAAAAQAELMEKEKTILEHQHKVQQMKSSINNMANQQVSLEREKRRSNITLGELATLQEDHVVYKGVGHMFVRSAVSDLTVEHKDREAKCGAESMRLSEEKKRLGTACQKEEEHLQAAVGDFMAAVRLIQATQQGTAQ